MVWHGREQGRQGADRARSAVSDVPGRDRLGERVVACVLPAAGALLFAGAACAFPDEPPVAVTGGFGEDSCHACHFDSEPDSGAGALSLQGWPERFTPGEVYPLTLHLTDPDMALAGFQLAVRFAEDGSQAGELSVPEQESARIGLLESRDVQYIHQQGPDQASAPDIVWHIEWTAPQADQGEVLVHAASVAGDGDASQVGDQVYLLEKAAVPGGD